MPTQLSSPALSRHRYTITGAVQGVGFRPFIYRIALHAGLTGNVRNSPEGVIIEVQGKSSECAEFATALREELPPLARIVTCDMAEIPPLESDDAFEILQSTGGEGHSVLISPDVATCPDCLNDIFDIKNHRYLYPFTNCTNCGPRYTITRSIPYDRDKTSMACFPMCESCTEEYTNPLDRRFHAQPNACPKCGPEVWMTDNTGKELYRKEPSLPAAARALAEGKILAVKGLGGFHLMCDARSSEAVQTLRQRKNRYGKPLAVMVPDMDTARQIATISDEEERWLSGIERPIVILSTPNSPLAPELNPDTPDLGLVLPYTPLHHVLFFLYKKLLPKGAIPALVATSGNLSSEPISIGNREAINRLGNIADFFVLHNRDILIRCDDSVMRVIEGTDGPQPLFYRKARGFTPRPIFLDHAGPSVFGTGPELKDTLCVTKGDQAFVSQHIGTMENLETFSFFKEIAQHLPAILQTRPELVVHDLHPDYMSTRWATEESQTPHCALQHHVAHAHAVMAENAFSGQAIILALDGTGYGEDGTLWGGEFLLVDNEACTHTRLAHFQPLPLPGGERAIREPWRLALSALVALGEDIPDTLPWTSEHQKEQPLVLSMLKKQLNSPTSTSCGRLFDAVAAMLGLCSSIDYEAQAAILLETAQGAMREVQVHKPYLCELRSSPEGQPAVFESLKLFQQAFHDAQSGESRATISRRFHQGLVISLAEAAQSLALSTGISHVGLTGGVLMNRTLAERLPHSLLKRGITPLTHTQLPPGDACISLGQAAYGQALLRKKSSE